MSPYLKSILFFWAVNAIFAVAFNLIYGYAGQFSLAHAGIAAVGAYTMSLLVLSPREKMTAFIIEPPIWPISVIQWPFVPALLLAGIIAGLVGFVIGAPALRLRGNGLVIVTLGLSEIIRLLLCTMPGVTNGALGLKGIPQQANLVWAWGLVALVILVTKRLVDSSYGRALKALKDDEIAAAAVGIAVSRHKLMAFTVSSFFVGIGGALLAQLLKTIDPNTFQSTLTFGVITTVILGGVGSITGSVLATGIYTIMSELLRAAEDPRTIMGINLPGIPGMRMLTFSTMLLVLILFYRRGLMGTNEFSWGWLLSKLHVRRVGVGTPEGQP